MREKGREPRLPEAPLAYLVEYLFEVGPAGSGGFGPAPISHVELLAWQENMRRRLQPWELVMLRQLSAQWVSQAQISEEHDCPSPWADEVVTAEEKRAVAGNLRDAIRGMAR